MRIKNVQLENFLGLLEGTGRSEIFVDFEPAHAAGLQRQLLFGRNGSGKTTLLNALTPFPSQGDERSVLIAPGRAGRKIITFDRDGTEVRCDVRWSSKGKTSCFVYLDGSPDPTRETAKGNVGEYLRNIEDLLGVTPEYLKIGRVGGRVSGFLDLGPSKRKEYIGQFMPEVEEWAAMHKNVAKRVSQMRSQLQGMQVELDRIEPREELENAGRRADAECARLREEIRALDIRIGSANGALAEMRPGREGLVRRADIQYSEELVFNPVAAVIDAVRKRRQTAAAQLSRLMEERPILARYTDVPTTAAKIAEIETTIARLSGEVDGTTQQRSSARSVLDRAIVEEKEVGQNLSRIETSTVQLDLLRTKLSEAEARTAELTEQADGLPGPPDGVSYEEVKAACDALTALEGEVSDLRGQFPSPACLDLARQLEMDDDRLAEHGVRNIIAARDVQQRLDVARARVATIEAQASFHRRFDGMHCSDPRCPFERHIAQFASAAQELGEKLDEIKVLEERVTSGAVVTGENAITRSAAKAVVAAHARVRKHRPTYVAAGIWDRVGPEAAFYTLVASTATDAALAFAPQRLLDAMAIKRDLTESARIADGLRERIAGLEALRSAKEQVVESRNRAVAAVEVARADLAVVEAKLSQLQSTLAAQEHALSLLRQLASLHDQVASADQSVESLSAISADLEQMRERWENADADFQEATGHRATAGAQLEEATSALSDARMRLGRRDEYEARIGEMQGRLARGQAVAEACHPAKGAPVEFLREFLDSTRDSVNDLLDVAMQGEFRIGFSLSESEFRIPVSRSSGRVIPDVTEASEGQLALAKTVLSLALVRQVVQATGRYNVICLDEIDGPLDKERNRERFAEIVDRLSIELGLEQLFMISHNDNFATAPAGLVLLPGHSMPISDRAFMQNKLVLADFS